VDSGHCLCRLRAWGEGGGKDSWGELGWGCSRGFEASEEEEEEDFWRIASRDGGGQIGLTFSLFCLNKTPICLPS